MPPTPPCVVEHLDLRNAIHVGHSTGGGEATRYAARATARAFTAAAAGRGRSADHQRRRHRPTGRPTHRGIDDSTTAPTTAPVLPRCSPSARSMASTDRALSGVPSRDRELVAAGDDGRAKAHYDGIKAFSETDFTGDLKGIDVPTLVMREMTIRSCRLPTPHCCR